MDLLKKDGTPDKRYHENKGPCIVEASKPLPTKDGYIQFFYRPHIVVNGEVSTKKV